MKKNKILLIILVVGIITLGIVIFIKSQAVTETKRLGNGENTNHNETSSSSKPSIQNTNQSSLAKNQNDELFIFNSDLKALREKYPDGVIYTNLPV